MISRRELGVTGIGEQMIGAVEDDEALRVPRGLEDPSRVLDADGVVDRRVHDEERTPERGELLEHLLRADVVDELPADGERATGQLDRRLTAALDLVDRVGEHAA